MRIVYQRCCGMDVHKNSITACLMLIDDDGEFRTYKREFGTMTRDLKAMSCWLESEGVQAVAMEATGVYWKPVWNILEAANKFTLVLVNAQHIKNVPGRKTDQKDSEWIAELLQHGLLQASFVPPREIRSTSRVCGPKSDRPWQVSRIESRRYWRTPISNWAR
jgi:transposase